MSSEGGPAEDFNGLLGQGQDPTDPEFVHEFDEDDGSQGGEGHDRVNLLDFDDDELGNGDRLVAWLRGDWRYLAPEKRWIGWEGRYWKRDHSNHARVTREAAAMAHAFADQVVDDGVPKERRDFLVRFIGRLRTLRGIDATITLAGRSLTTDGAEFDRDIWTFNCANGCIDLRTGLLLPHHREQLHTRLSPVPFHPDAEAPRWDRFLLEIMQDDEELVAYLQRAVGYSLTGDMTEHAMFIMWGDGANGKSTFLRVLEEILGPYAAKAESSAFLRRQRSGPRNDIASLVGARLIMATESGEKDWLNEALIKEWTGGDSMTARRLHQEFFTFQPTGKLWLASNYRPRIRGADTGIWRRVRLLPFQAHIPPEQRDPHLLAKLRAEAPGVLAWAVRGCVDWRRLGRLGMPAALRRATVTYRDDMDHISLFVRERLEEREGGSVGAQELFAAYREWCAANAYEEGSQKVLGGHLTRRGFERVKSHGVYEWRGIELRGAAPGGRVFGLRPHDD